MRASSSTVSFSPTAQLLRHWLTAAVCAGVALCLLLPATRSYSVVWGWTPLWLVGMPAVAWLVVQVGARVDSPAPQRASLRRGRRAPQAQRNGTQRTRHAATRRAA